jgi:hypothetical protein
MVLSYENNRGKRLRRARRTKFRSGRAAALALGIPVATYGSHERAQSPGGRDYGPEEAQRYADAFGVTPEWLLTGRRDPQTDALLGPERPSPTRTPVVGYVGAGDEAHYYAVEPGFLEEIDLSPLHSEHLGAFDIRDRYSFGLEFKHWLVFFNYVREPVTPDLLGCLCVIGLPDGRVFVLQLEPGKTEGKYDLLGGPGPNHRDVEVSWACKVIAFAPPEKSP